MTDELRPQSDGFTLTETLVVISILGFVAIVIAATFTIIVRTAPTTEARADDARSLLGLTNWLSQDVLSTAETGFEDSSAAARCTGLPAGSSSLVQLQWDETDSYVVNYRWVPTSVGLGVVTRFSCIEGQVADEVRVSSELRELDVSTCGSSPAGECPIPIDVDLIPSGPSTVDAVEFSAFVVDDNGTQRELLELHAATANVVNTLPPLGGGGGGANQAPLAGPALVTITTGTSVVLDLDPVTFDVNGDPLTVTFANVPALWNVTSIGTDVTITPDAGATPGPYQFNYTVTDPGGEQASSTIDVDLQASSGNLHPIANPVDTTASKGLPRTVALPASDPEGATLTATVSGVPGNWLPSISGLNVTLTPPSNAAGSYTFNYTVTDDVPQSSSSTITVNVCGASITSVTPSIVQVDSSTGNLSSSVQVEIADNGFCNALVLGYLPRSTDTVESTKSFSGNTNVVIGATDHVWEYRNRNVALNLRETANGAIEDGDVLRTTKN